MLGSLVSSFELFRWIVFFIIHHVCALISNRLMGKRVTRVFLRRRSLVSSNYIFLVITSFFLSLSLSLAFGVRIRRPSFLVDQHD